MTKLEMKKLASDLAFGNAAGSRAQLDAAVGAAAAERKLSDGDYNGFKNDASLFWTHYSNAQNADASADNAKKPAAPAVPVPQAPKQ